MTGSSISVELTDGQLKELMRDALAGKETTGLEDLDVSSPALSTASGRALLAATSDSKLSMALIQGLLVFSAFPENGALRSTTDISVELEMRRNMVHRLVRTLEFIGLLQRDRRSGRYRRWSRRTTGRGKASL